MSTENAPGSCCFAVITGLPKPARGNGKQESAHVLTTLDPQLTEVLRHVAAEENLDLSQLLFAALRILCERYKGLESEAPADLSFRDTLRRRVSDRQNTHEGIDHSSVRICLRLMSPGGKPDFDQADLFLSLQNFKTHLEGRWTFAREAFDPSVVLRLDGHYRTLLQSLAKAPGKPAWSAALMTEYEQKAITEWNRTESEYPRNATVHELFTKLAKDSPDAIAVVDGRIHLTYRQLNEHANQLARYLQRIGVGPSKTVGISLDRSASMVVAMLAVLKAGCCYLPLDANYPAERLRLMIEDGQVRLILTNEARAQLLSSLGSICVRLDSDVEIGKESTGEPSSDVNAWDLAYVMYTSGSTGNPKGVEIRHRSIVRLVRNTNYIDIQPSDTVAQVSNFSFDATTFEVWGPLLNGARVVIIPTEAVLSPDRLSIEIHGKNVSIMFLTTALFNQIARANPAAFSPLRHLLMGGEAASPGCQARVLEAGPPTRMLHVYGPTECTTFALWHLIENVPADAATIPIGRPISNTTAFVLDRHLQPVPAGVPGELYLGGDGLARGYLNHAELTEARFVSHAVMNGDPVRLYKTGDKVRLTESGDIEFLGRTDHQVKLRGFRIELDEVEGMIRRHPDVAECVVVLRENQLGEKRLVAYAAKSAGTRLSEAQIRDFLRDKLPDFMIPSIFVVMDALPLSPVGKVDRNALPDPESVRRDRRGESPSSDVQKAVAGIWQRLLGGADLGLDDNFFEVGGNSLLLMIAEGDIRATLWPGLLVTDLFRYPTIRSISAHITSTKKSDPSWLDQTQQRVKNQKMALEKKRRSSSQHK